ncbi:MAG TPA: glycine betaine ABC transporter substrate-binding protein [Blastocatellia bacterium]|nr:glycine betaine ABC transporter substrate-binding protein [Blastocatellia bacterium]HMX25764.1 glycine betaine ABC transporter substrate-binding protein [Blastocatellia bacterium]HMY70787.1 glycine betaine ABC transporter substrate-binding protein [Blastocatellia bacterium]HNG28523.1 glycine betaine ABC transporter substrate-binding protein [Blastocatellia bacterium]
MSIYSHRTMSENAIQTIYPNNCADGKGLIRCLCFVGVLLLVYFSECTFSTAQSAPLRVGSKRDTESVILGSLTAAWLKTRKIDAVYRGDISGGTQVLWRALLHGDIDVYPEFTGTLAREILRDEKLTTIAALRERLAPLGLTIGEPLGFEDNYGIGMRAERARELGLTRISDLRAHPTLRFGFSHDFLDRADGFPGLQKRYGLPQQSPLGFEHELAYRALAEGRVDAIEVYTTDAEIDVYGMRLLEDDLQFFPRYEPVLIYRADGLAGRAQGPTMPAAAREALRGLEGRITREEMMKMNRRARIDKVPESEVAATFLRGKLGVTAAAEQDSRWTEIAQRTKEHLLLVLISMLFAVVVSLPMGILAARLPRLGQTLLGVLGIFQTIPSLALLVFMIPLVGIGRTPAVLALFLYSLLPIVRGTTTGLLDIPAALRESAEALGLSRMTQLFRIELPLASRSILSGIKTAAVINVGTATIGALIGAGGYGQPILVGIRRDDIGTILQGAIPAAVLALLLQGVFELIERLVRRPE